MLYGDEKLKKSARLLSHKKGGSLRPDAKPSTQSDKQSNTQSSTKNDVKKSESTKSSDTQKAKTSHASKAHESRTTNTASRHASNVSGKSATPERTKSPKDSQKESHKESQKKSSHKAETKSPAKKVFEQEHKSSSNVIGKEHAGFAHSKSTAVAPAPVSGSQHLVIGLLIGLLLLATAYFWPSLPFNKGKISDPGQTKVREVVSATIEDINLGGGQQVNDTGDSTVLLDEDGFGVINEADLLDEDVLQDTDEDLQPIDTSNQVDNSVVVTSNNSPENDIYDQDLNTPTVEVNDEPTTYVSTQPARVYGDWELLYMNTEKFDIEDEDDDVTELYLKDVCKSIFKQNPNVVSFCRKTSQLKRSTSDDLGAEKCDGGGTCRLGQTCLLWNDDEEDDGDLRSYTAMYRCE